MKNLKRVSRFLQSFAMSTAKKIVFEHEGYRFDGVNSPYTSHQTCVMDSGHGVRNTVILYTKWECAVISLDIRDEKHFVIPASWGIQAITQGIPEGVFPFGIPQWIQKPGTILCCVMADRFRGYDPEGKPQFDNRNIIDVRPCEINFHHEFDFIFEDSNT